jgi:pyrimidine operon attenuation protein/uracil phosphoribosyltransferase
MSEQPTEEELTNVSFMNILATAVLVNNNHLELPMDVVLADFSDKNISLSYDEDRRTLILELVELESEDESGQISEESA